MNEGQHRARVVVVGPCAAGKTTLVSNLRLKNFSIYSCAQEHSAAPQLWKKHCRADVLVYLDAELETIALRQRRSDWTARRLEAQRRRLADARLHCDYYLQTDGLTRQQVALAVQSFLELWGIIPDQGDGNDH